MIEIVLLAALVTWLLLSAVTTVACVALVRGGAREERMRGLVPRDLGTRPPRGRGHRVASPCRNGRPVAEFHG